MYTLIIALLAIISVFVMPRNLVQSGSRVKPVNEVQTVTGTEYATPVQAPAAEAPVEEATETVVAETVAEQEAPAVAE